MPPLEPGPEGRIQNGVLDEAHGLLSRLFALRNSTDDPLATPVAEQPWGRKLLKGFALDERVGRYRLMRELGRGGMSVVFLAEPTDGHFRKVAVKLLDPAHSAKDFRARFDEEITILESLEHEHVARLYDVGTTDEGQAFIVMEYVNGSPIDVYCRDRKCDIPERLQLFLNVCQGVAYAQEHLIVHRDLKPSNILVNEEGAPKVIDFGIAKLISIDQNVTGTTMPFMTPEYASPEQFLGKPVTTAMDVYALGVILYELLTGCLPHSSNGRSPHEFMRAVLEDDPVPPRTFEPLISKELEAITLMALRKEPERRYLSVDQFQEDLKKLVAGLPVRAHKDSQLYRARKFVGRNPKGVVAWGLFIVTVLGLLLVVLDQKRLADRRFEDVRALSGSVFRDVLHVTWDLPGAEEANYLIRQKAVQFREGLVRETPNDWRLKRELLSAYFQLGSNEGDPETLHMGKTQASYATQRKALALAEEITHQHPQNAGDQLSLGHALNYVGKMAQEMGKTLEAESYFNRAIKINRAVSGSNAVSLDRKLVYAHSLSLLALVRAQQDDQRAPLLSEEAVEIREKHLQEPPEWTRLKRGFTMALRIHASVLDKVGRHQDAIPVYQRVISLENSIAGTSKRPDVMTNLLLALAHEGLGRAFYGLGKTEEAQRYLESALMGYRRIAKENFKSARPQRLLATGLEASALTCIQAGNDNMAIAALEAALPLSEGAVTGDPANGPARQELARLRALRARLLEGR